MAPERVERYENVDGIMVRDDRGSWIKNVSGRYIKAAPIEHILTTYDALCEGRDRLAGEFKQYECENHALGGMPACPGCLKEAKAQLAEVVASLKECKALFDSEEYKGIWTLLYVHGFKEWSGPKVDMEKLNKAVLKGVEDE